jgi:CheY-like chemotaxis protein
LAPLFKVSHNVHLLHSIALSTRWGGESLFIAYHVFGSHSELSDYLAANRSRAFDIKGVLVDMEAAEAPTICDNIRSDVDFSHVTVVGFNAPLIASAESRVIGIRHILHNPPLYSSFKAAMDNLLGTASHDPSPSIATVRTKPRPPPRSLLLRETPAQPVAPTSTSSSVDVLVVEDNQMNQRITCLMLEKLGFKAHIANNGPEALDMLAKSNPAYGIVLMDIQMPIMSGWEASAKIKALNLVPSPIVIAATAASTMSDRNKSLEQMDDYISKPMSMQNLRDTLERAWNRSRRPPLKFASEAFAHRPVLAVGSVPSTAQPTTVKPAPSSNEIPSMASNGTTRLILKDRTGIVQALVATAFLLSFILAVVVLRQ